MQCDVHGVPAMMRERLLPAAALACLHAALLPSTAEMYDLVLPSKEPPDGCAHGCARWRALQADGVPQPQHAADAMWRRGSPPAENDCAMPGQAVQCCNMMNASLAGLWPNCCPVWQMVPAPAPFGSLGAVCPGAPAWQLAGAAAAATAHASASGGGHLSQEEYTDKAGLKPPAILGDSPLCYPGTPAHSMSGPGFNGAFCWCRHPAPGDPAWGLCTSPPAAVEQLNLQLAGPTTVVVSFATFRDPAALKQPPAVEYRVASESASDSAEKAAVKIVRGVTHVYSMNATGLSKTANKTYFLHFVRLDSLAERTTYSYRVRSGGGRWNNWRNFTSLYTTGVTRLAMFGDMGVYSWNAMGGLLADSKAGEIDTIVHMGDHAYNYGDANGSRADGYLDGYSPVLGSTPWVPVVGNHEGFDSFYFFFNETDGTNSAVDSSPDDMLWPAPHPMTTMMRTGVGQFGAGSAAAAVADQADQQHQPRRHLAGSGTPRWFSLQIGLVHLVAVDCMVNWAPPASVHNQTDPDARAMLEWLEADLRAIDRALTPWVVVVAHYPVFCSGCLTGTPAGMPAALEPLFIRHGVDIFSAGHWHYYESLWPTVSTNGQYGVPNASATQPRPTRHSFLNPDATVYVTAGNGGSPGPDGGAATLPGARFGSEQYGYGRLVAHNASHLTWTQVANRGAGGVIDEWTVVQHRHGEFHPGPGLTPAPAPVPTPPPLPPGPPAKASLQLVSLDICRHYWNWACNDSSIPGGANGGGQGSCCMANISDPWFSWRDQGSGSPSDLQLYTARPASADAYYFMHTAAGATRPPKAMPDYRMADYAENSYFGPRQGPGGVWNGINTSSTGFGRWAYGSGGPRALYDGRKSHQRGGGGGEEGTSTSPDWLVQPLGYELLLAGPSAAWPSVSPVAVWRPIAPPGFTALGAVITAGAGRRPKLSAVRVLADACVAMCVATQIWCDARAPAGRCGPVDGKRGGWSTAAYVASAGVGGGLGETAGSVSAAVPMNLLWVAANRTDIVTAVPCVRASCLA
eukprot:SAG22_NODE_186_length_15907_cov_45.496774_7_plen_1025_part_00